MKISEETISILKNFQAINSSIQIDKGNIISTKSQTNTAMAKAKVPDEFPVTFAIYDLRRFLSVALMCKNSEIEFDKKFLLFVDGKKKVKYSYCNPETIVIPENKPYKFKDKDVYMEFELSADILKETISAMGVLGHDGIVIKGEEGKLILTTSTSSLDDYFSVEIGETDKNFSIILEASKLNMIPKTYNVVISRQKYVYFGSENLEYWIASNLKSTIND